MSIVYVRPKAQRCPVKPESRRTSRFFGYMERVRAYGPVRGSRPSFRFSADVAAVASDRRCVPSRTCAHRELPFPRFFEGCPDVGRVFVSFSSDEIFFAFFPHGFPFGSQYSLLRGNYVSFRCLIASEKGRSYFCVSTASGRSEECFVSFKFSNVMAKRAAVLAVDPVNGMGLFEYLETFYENGVGYEVFAVSDTTDIRTNSGVRLRADDTVGNLRGRSDDFDALVFACGDAVPLFAQHASEPHNVALLDVIREFAAKDKLLVGHCAAAMIFSLAGVCEGRRVAVHPLAAPAVAPAVVADEAWAADGNFFTARNEHAVEALLPAVLNALK